MAQLDTHQPSKIFRGTIDEVLRHRDEIPAEAQVELRVWQEEPKPVLDEKTKAAIAFLEARIAEGLAADPDTKRQAEEELAEFKRNMNANRAATGERPVYP